MVVLIKVIVFDRDQTLLRYDPRTMVAQAREVIPGLTREDLMLWWRSIAGHTVIDRDGEPAFWVMFWQSLARSRGCTDEQVDRLGRMWEQIPTMYSPFPDTTSCLTRLRDSGLRLALLTNSPIIDIESTLRHAHVDPQWFTALVNAFPHAKPAATAYQKLLDALPGVAAADCLFVDDEAANVHAAINAGMRGILIDRLHSGQTRLPAARSLSEVADFALDLTAHRHN